MADVIFDLAIPTVFNNATVMSNCEINRSRYPQSSSSCV